MMTAENPLSHYSYLCFILFYFLVVIAILSGLNLDAVYRSRTGATPGQSVPACRTVAHTSNQTKKLFDIPSKAHDFRYYSDSVLEGPSLPN